MSAGIHEVSQRQGPLTDLKVIEVCSTIAGPACARLLADFGADVIKIEPPDGDPVRQMGSMWVTSLCTRPLFCATSARLPWTSSPSKAGHWHLS